MRKIVRNERKGMSKNSGDQWVECKSQGSRRDLERTDDQEVGMIFSAVLTFERRPFFSIQITWWVKDPIKNRLESAVSFATALPRRLSCPRSVP